MIFQMLGREALDQRQRRLERGRDDDRAVVAPARAGDLLPRQFGELALDLGRDRARERGIVGDQDRLRRRVVLGLGEQVGGDEARIGAAVGEDRPPRTGPAIMSMPTTPNTRRLAAAT